MDEALSIKTFQPATIKQIYFGCMYLNVLLLSNITMPNGKQLEDAVYNGDRSGLHSHDPGHLVNQAKPNVKAWAKWKQFLHHLCQRDSLHTLKRTTGPVDSPSL